MGYENLKKLVQYCRNIQIKDDSDIFFGVTGRKGSGKTTFSIEASRLYVREYFGEEYFSLNKYMCFNNKDVFEKMHTLPMYSPIAGDEAIRFAWSREWNKLDNKDLIKLSTQIRPKKHILFLNIPRMVWIDKAYREGMLSMWAWIHSQINNGKKECYAILFEPDENQGEEDSWHLKKLKQQTSKVRKIGKFTDIDTMYKLVKNHPCFMDIIKFPQVPKEIYDKYMQMRTENVMKKESEYIDQKDMAKIICWNIKNNYDNFVKAINEGRFSKPTYWMIADILCHDPIRKKRLVRNTTIRNWIEEINQIVGKPKEMQEVLKNPDNQIEERDEDNA